MKYIIKYGTEIARALVLGTIFLVVGGMLMSIVYGKVSLKPTGMVSPSGHYSDPFDN